MKKNKTLFSSIFLSLMLLALACSTTPITPPAPTNTTPPTGITSENLSIDTTTETQQGWIEFPYKSADAGHFSLQAGENIAFTWLNYPPEAAFYTIAVKSNREDQLIIIGTDFDGTDGVRIDWNVKEHIGGLLVGFACFEDDSCIGTDFSGEIGTGALPPEEYCSAKLFSIGTVNIYLEPDQNSPIMGYMIPGIFTEVYTISKDRWLTIDLTNHAYTSEDYRSITTGYVVLQRPIELFGPCDSNQEN